MQRSKVSDWYLDMNANDMCWVHYLLLTCSLFWGGACLRKRTLARCRASYASISGPALVCSCSGRHGGSVFFGGYTVLEKVVEQHRTTYHR